MPATPAYAAVDNPQWAEWIDRGYKEDLGRYPVPPHLHHYTGSVDAVLSIISTRVMRATETATLKDKTELRHGWSICQRALELVRHPALIPHVELLRHGMKEQFGYKVYVASYSESANLASQWREYANHGRGFAISFDSRTMTSVRGGERDPVRLMPVEYRIEVQEHRARRAVLRALEDLEKHAESTAPSFAYTANRFTALAVEMFFQVASFKAEGYHPENEWRLLYARPDNDPAALTVFVNGDSGQKRYVELDLRRTWSGPQPIFSAIHGGSHIHANCADTVQRFLRERRLDIPWVQH